MFFNYPPRKEGLMSVISAVIYTQAVQKKNMGMLFMTCAGKCTKKEADKGQNHFFFVTLQLIKFIHFGGTDAKTGKTFFRLTANPFRPEKKEKQQIYI